MKRVTCKSGLEGWQARLQENYTGLEEFERYCELYGLHRRLGYRSPAAAWKANPLVQGSVNPKDFRRVRK
jgi:hypothetical protein